MSWSYDLTAKLKLNVFFYLNYNSRYTALTALGIGQEVEHIMANVFYSTFLNVFFILATFFNVFFFIFPGTFFTSMQQSGCRF